MGLFDINPQAVSRNYGAEMRKALEAQIGLMGPYFQAMAGNQGAGTTGIAGLQNGLNLQNIDQFLTGTGEQEYDIMGWQAPVYSRPQGGRQGGGISQLQGFNPFLPGYNDKTFGMGGSAGSSIPGGFIPGQGSRTGMSKYIPGPLDTVDPISGMQGLMGLFGDDEKKAKARLLQRGQYVKTGTGRRAAQRGFLDIYNESIIPEMLKARTQQRSGDISDIQNLSPAAREALRTSNPQAAQLLDQLYGDATRDLSLGAQLNQSETRNISNAVRGGQAARGMGMGPRDNFDEALTSLDYGRGLQADRRSFAGATSGLLDNFYGRSLNAILGRDISGAAGGLAGMGQGGGMAGGALSSFMNPESQYSYGINDFNANSQQSANNIAAQNNAAMLSGIMNMVGQMGGGAMGMMCWVAREVYGSEKAEGGMQKWKVFRHWMLTRASLELLHAYLKDGAEFARYIADKPALKARVRRFMDGKIIEVSHGV